MLLEHHHNTLADRSHGRSFTSLDIDRKASLAEKAKAFSYSTSPDDNSSSSNANYMFSSPSVTGPSNESHESRTKIPNHRFTIGPEKTEKIWSIGSGDGAEEDGLVEKSVAEAMAGVEPNARSRKASYSLRFFKEGLPPEDKARRRDTKTAPRDKPLQVVDETGGLSPSYKAGADDTRRPQDVPETPEGSTTGADREKVKSPLLTSPLIATPDAATDTDYFTLNLKDATNESAPSSKLPATAASHEDSVAPEGYVGPIRPAAPDGDDVEGRRGSGDSTEVGEARDDNDADESGEEKISSAVFVPHQELAEPRKRDGDNLPGHISRPRSLSEDDPHPWLVKADEPEPEATEHDDQASRLSRFRSRESLISSRGELASEHSEDFSVEAEHEIQTQQGTVHSRPAATPYDDYHIHEHQQRVRQPLEAIELIPYKHQVGGHTTLWRFSRRAVCKQLNNRENEFYEIIERYHRDLLSFLPR
jgi:hypothetical protein